MSILHTIDFIALCVVVIYLCEELRKLDGKNHPLIAIGVAAFATLAFLSGTYDLAGAPLHVVAVLLDVCAAIAVVLFHRWRETP